MLREGRAPRRVDHAQIGNHGAHGVLQNTRQGHQDKQHILVDARIRHGRKERMDRLLCELLRHVEIQYSN